MSSVAVARPTQGPGCSSIWRQGLAPGADPSEVVRACQAWSSGWAVVAAEMMAIDGAVVGGPRRLAPEGSHGAPWLGNGPSGSETQVTARSARSPVSACAVMVVDDDPSILEIVTEVLHSEGYPVHAAAHGGEALDAVERVRPNVILLDMRMPVVDGWQFVRLLRERGWEVPVVVMTAAQDAPRWAREVGAAAVLPKPFDITTLLSVVEQLCPGR